MISTAFSSAATGMVAALALFALPVPLQAKDFIKAERPQQRGYSQAVITEGGKTVWLAGQTATVDDAGKSLAGDFEGQTRQIFKLLNATLEKAGGRLGDMQQLFEYGYRRGRSGKLWQSTPSDLSLPAPPRVAGR